MTDKLQHPKHNRRPRKIKYSRLFLRLPDDLRDGLEAIAEREERTLSAVARLAFREYIAKSAGRQ